MSLVRGALDLERTARTVAAAAARVGPCAGRSGEDRRDLLAYTENTELVALRTDDPVEPAREDGRRVWLHHGSSINR